MHNVVCSEKILQKYGFLYVPISCVRFARNCGKVYSHHLFLYGGLSDGKDKYNYEEKKLLYSSPSQLSTAPSIETRTAAGS